MKFVNLFSPVPLQSDPQIAEDGELYFNSSSNIYRYFYSGSWASLITSNSHVTNVVGKVYNIGAPDVAYLSHIVTDDQAVGGILLINTASSTAIMISDSDSLDAHVGCSFTVIRNGTGTVGIIGDGNTSIISPSPHYLTAQYSTVKITKLGEDLWSISGEFPDIY